MTQHYCDILDDHITGNMVYKIVNKADGIINLADELYNAYVDSKYYHADMKRCDINTKNIMLSCDTNEHSCVLCGVVHKMNNQKLYYNDNDHACLSCHKKKIIIQKCDKKAISKEEKDEQAFKFINEFYDVHESDESITVIEENSRYLSCDINNTFQWRSEYSNPFIVLDAQMGKGKTQFIKNFLKRSSKGNRDISILVVSQRKSYTHFICDELKEYNIQSYLDVKGNNHADYDSLCIQIESLRKVGCKTYDYIILDEVETILNQFSSTTMEFVNDSFGTLEYLISQAKTTILADAFITTRTMEYIKMVKTRRDHITVLRNTKLFLEDRKAIQIDGTDFIPNILTALENGKKIAVVSTSRTDVLDIVSCILQNEKTKGKNVKYYDRFSNKDDLKDVNESWANADVVIYTPVITTGISYTNDRHVFDTIFLNCKNTCQARDLMQMAMRIRNLRENAIYFALSGRQTFTVNNIAFGTFKTFENDIRNRGSEILKITVDEALKERIQRCMTTFDKKLLHIMFYNMREQAISSKYYQQLCIYLFEKQGYKVIPLETKAVDLKPEKIEFNHTEKYNTIETLSYAEVKALKAKDVDQSTQMSIDKFYFENMLVKDLQDEVKGKLFFDYYQNVYKKSILENLRIEKSDVDFDKLMSTDLVKSDNLLNKLTLKSLKLNHVRKMNKILSLKSSCENAKVIQKDNHKIISYLMKNIDSINTAFSTKYKFIEKNKVQNNLTCFNMLEKIYGSWSGMKFKPHQRSNKGTQSYITNTVDVIDYLAEVKTRKTIEELFMGEED
jgi:hypothetical protein